MSDQLISETKTGLQWLQQQHRKSFNPTHRKNPGTPTTCTFSMQEQGWRQQKAPGDTTYTSKHMQRDSAPTPPCETLSRAVSTYGKPQEPTLTFLWQLTLDPIIKPTIPCITTFPGENKSPKDQYLKICKSRGWTMLLRPVTWIIKG